MTAIWAVIFCFYRKLLGIPKETIPIHTNYLCWFEKLLFMEEKNMNKRFVKKNYTDFTAEVFNENVAIMYLFSDEQSHDYWLFKCPFCKSLYVTRLDRVKLGYTKSCGCLNNAQWRKQIKQKHPRANTKHIQEIKRDFVDRVIRFATENNRAFKFTIDSVLENYESDGSDETGKMQQLESIVQIYLKEIYDGYTTLQKLIL